MEAAPTVIDAILQENLQVLKQIDASLLQRLLELLSHASSIFVCGKGRSGFIARCFAMRLMHLGLRAYVVDETITPAIGPGDVLIACSGSGETEETCLAAEKANRIGSQVIAITAEAGSRLTQVASLSVVLSAPHKNSVATNGISLQYAGSLFEQSTLLFCDGIILQEMQARQSTCAELASRHANLE
ncbi:MAG TPA: 6-phospho-3-hexuloisomerase [Ktedonobacteraceae bacterium]